MMLKNHYKRRNAGIAISSGIKLSQSGSGIPASVIPVTN
jgi:hypothetical protein